MKYQFQNDGVDMNGRPCMEEILTVTTITSIYMAICKLGFLFISYN